LRSFSLLRVCAQGTELSFDWSSLHRQRTPVRACAGLLSECCGTVKLSAHCMAGEKEAMHGESFSYVFELISKAIEETRVS
jgi:hypothetical protein